MCHPPTLSKMQMRDPEYFILNLNFCNFCDLMNDEFDT